MGRHGAECMVFRRYYLIIIKSSFIYRETVRASGIVPGEHTVGQRQLTVQLAVGGRKMNSIPNWAGLFIGTYDVIMT